VAREGGNARARERLDRRPRAALAAHPERLDHALLHGAERALLAARQVAEEHLEAEHLARARGVGRLPVALEGDHVDDEQADEARGEEDPDTLLGVRRRCELDGADRRRRAGEDLYPSRTSP